MPSGRMSRWLHTSLLPEWALGYTTPEARKRSAAARVILVGVLWAMCLLLTVHFHFVLHTQILVAHLYYIPIILAALYWGTRGLSVALISGAFLLASHDLAFATPLGEDVVRACMFVVVSLVASWLSERIRQTTRAVADGEKNFEAIVEAAVDGILLADAETQRFLMANQAICQMTGYSLEELQEMGVEDIHPQEDLDYVLEQFEKQAAGIIQLAPELPVRRKDGSIFYADINTGPLILGGKPHLLGSFRDVTERKRAEARIAHLNQVLQAIRDVNQLIASERDRERLLQGACDALTSTRGYHSAWIALFDKHDRFVLGFEAGLGDSFTPFREALQRGELPRCMRDVLGKSEVITVEHRSTSCADCPLAEVYPGAAAMAVRLEHAGEVYGLMSVSLQVEMADSEEEQSLFAELSSDIAFGLNAMALEAERKRADERISFQKALLEAQAEASIDGILVVDETGQIISFNRRFAEMWRIPQDILDSRSDELVLQSVVGELVHPEAFLARVEYLYEHQDDTSEDEIALTEGRTFDRYSAPVRDADGQYLGRIWYFRDITERKRAEEMVQAERDRAQNYLDMAASMLAVVDADEKVSLLNTRGCEILGYSEEGIIGQNWFDILVPENIREQVRAVFGQLMDGDVEPVTHYENSLLTKSGEQRLIAFHNTVLRDADGNIHAVLLSGEDITERKQTEEALRQAQKMEAVGTLSAGIAHDFNNILQTVIGRVQFMLTFSGLDTQATKNLEEVASTALRGASLVKRLLVFSRHIGVHKHTLNLGMTIEDVRHILERTTSKLITIQTDVAHDLWPVEADAYHIEQALLNMGMNAVDAMPDGGSLRMATENRVVDETDGDLTAGQYVVLTVADTGIGIDEESLEHVFEPFYTSKGRAEHSGLGLAVVHGIVEAHHGVIRVSSEPGMGTTFEIYLPLAEAVHPGEEMDKELPVTDSGPLTVLVVDDEPGVGRLLCDILEESGHHTLRALDGEEGLEVFRAHHQEIDLVMLDLIMPGLGGEQCLDEMLGINPDAVAIIVSGYALDDHARERLEPRIKGFLAKPFEISAVLEAVNRAISL